MKYNIDFHDDLQIFFFDRHIHNFNRGPDDLVRIKIGNLAIRHFWSWSKNILDIITYILLSFSEWANIRNEIVNVFIFFIYSSLIIKIAFKKKISRWKIDWLWKTNKQVDIIHESNRDV